MARYDKYSITTWGIPSAVLMENAGRNTFRLMKERYLSGGERVAIVCGPRQQRRATASSSP
jgi:NAD(P)H-hydrate repair Nnr-like enzyme with NAD(P)H-hydrate epimerase domain